MSSIHYFTYDENGLEFFKTYEELCKSPARAEDTYVYEGELDEEECWDGDFDMDEIREQTLEDYNNKNKDNEIKKLKKENEKLKKENEKFKKLELVELDHHYNEEDIEEMHKEIEELREQILKLEKENEKLKKENEKFKEQFKNDCIKLTDSFDKAMKEIILKHNKCMEEIEKLTKENEEQKELIEGLQMDTEIKEITYDMNDLFEIVVKYGWDDDILDEDEDEDFDIEVFLCKVKNKLDGNDDDDDCYEKEDEDKDKLEHYDEMLKDYGLLEEKNEKLTKENECFTKLIEDKVKENEEQKELIEGLQMDTEIKETTYNNDDLFDILCNYGFEKDVFDEEDENFNIEEFFENLKEKLEEHEELENEKEEWETKEENYEEKIEEMEKQIKNYKINEEQKELLINDLKTKLKDEKENKKTFGVVSYENGELFEMVKEFGFDHILDMDSSEENFDIYKFLENVHTKMGEIEKMKIEIDVLKMKLLKHKKVIAELLE